ncbi:MAG: DMT family transporter [Rhodobacterales bacterium]
MSERILGILLVTISALVFSTVGLFIKSVSAGSWEVIFWRGVFAVAFSFIYVLARGRIKREIFNMGKGGLLVAFVGAVATSAFVPAFKLTTIANVTLIYAATPMIAAILAFAFVGERLSRAAIVGIGLAFIGVAIIVFGSLGQLNFTGDMLALVMTFGMASVIVLYRVFPATPAAGPAMLSLVILLAPAMILGQPFGIDPDELPILAVFGLVFTIASITLAEGAKRISAGQTALLSVLETPLAPLLAWLVLVELPAIATVIGGSLVFCAVIYGQFSIKS